MTVHVISVGLSVLDALEEPEAKFGGKHNLITAIRSVAPCALLDTAGIGSLDRDKASDWMAAALSAEDSGPRRALMEAAGAVHPREWPLNMSAETETFGRVRSRDGFSLSNGDKVVFLCSDTPAGLLAGVWNALAIADGDLDLLRYVPDPDSLSGDVRGRAVLVRVTGMDARNNAEFVKAMAGLGRLARRLFSSGSLDKAEEFRFYLSGGYKAAIPYLIGMAEAVRSVDARLLGDLGMEDHMPDSGLYPVKAYVLHETAEQGSPPIELPLRRVIARVVRNELDRYENGHRTGKPEHAILDGYAYEVTGGKEGREGCELTPFGAGLIALFGLAREGFGG